MSCLKYDTKPNGLIIKDDSDRDAQGFLQKNLQHFLSVCFYVARFWYTDKTYGYNQLFNQQIV